VLSALVVTSLTPISHQ